MAEANYIHSSAHVNPCAVLGKNNTIMEGAIIRAGVVMGDNNYVGPYCIIGDDGEKVGFWGRIGKVVIGDNNRFTKQVTIDCGTEGVTKIFNDCIFLKNAHVGHDALIGNGVILSCNAVIGGHTAVGSRTNFGLGAVAHQRLVIPAKCMIGMNSTITKKTVMAEGRKYAGSPARDIGENNRGK